MRSGRVPPGRRLCLARGCLCADLVLDFDEDAAKDAAHQACLATAADMDKTSRAYYTKLDMTRRLATDRLSATHERTLP